MKITLLAIGTIGDLNPLLALGIELRQLGYEVKIVTHQVFEHLAHEYGFKYGLIRCNPAEILNSRDADLIKSLDSSKGYHQLQACYYFTKMQTAVLEQVLIDCWKACQDSDAVIYSILGRNAVASIVEKLRIPSVGVYLQPVHPTKVFAHPISTKQGIWKEKMNQFSWQLGEIFMWTPFRAVINRWREEYLGLPPIKEVFFYWDQLRKQEELVLYAISPSVLPFPPDWDSHIQITGYLFLNQRKNWLPDPHLVDFLNQGVPPFYIGFGSVDSHPEFKRNFDLIIKILEQHQQRAILSIAASNVEIGYLSKGIFQVGYVPHDWIFPYVSAIVHQGGAGTTAEGLRAGKPAIILPIMLDQYFWAWRVAELGAGTQPIPFCQLGEENFAQALNEILYHSSKQVKARALGEKISEENGNKKCGDLIHRYLQKKVMQ